MSTKHTPGPCGGQLVRSLIGKPGDSVACPFCGKTVMLRRPFNGNNTGWVQVPRHNSARLSAAARNAFFDDWERNVAKATGEAS